MSCETPPDRTGAATTVTREPDRFVIEVEGRAVGLADYHDTDGRRVFTESKLEYADLGRTSSGAQEQVHLFI